MYYDPLNITIAYIVLIFFSRKNKYFIFIISVIYLCIFSYSTIILNETVNYFKIINNSKIFLQDNYQYKIIPLSLLVSTILIHIFAYIKNDFYQLIIGTLSYTISVFIIFTEDIFILFYMLELLYMLSTVLIFISHETQNKVKYSIRYFITTFSGNNIFLFGLGVIVYNNDITNVTEIANLIDSSKVSIITLSILIPLLINICCFPFSCLINLYYSHSNTSSTAYLTTFSTYLSIILIIKFFLKSKLLMYLGVITVIYNLIMLLYTTKSRDILLYLTTIQLSIMIVLIGHNANRITIINYMLINMLYRLGCFIYINTIKNNFYIKKYIFRQKKSLFNILLAICYIFITHLPYSLSVVLSNFVLDTLEQNLLYITIALTNIIIYYRSIFIFFENLIEDNKYKINLYEFYAILTFYIMTVLSTLFLNILILSFKITYLVYQPLFIYKQIILMIFAMLFMQFIQKIKLNCFTIKFCYFRQIFLILKIKIKHIIYYSKNWITDTTKFLSNKIVISYNQLLIFQNIQTISIIIAIKLLLLSVIYFNCV